MYGGDEICSLVFDIGSLNGRYGYAGEDTPRNVFQNNIGVPQDLNINNDVKSIDINQDIEMTSGNDKQSIKRSCNDNGCLFGEHELRYCKKNTRVLNPINNNGYIDNLELFEMLLNNVYSKSFKVDSRDHPILFSEPAIHNKNNRMNLAQLMFEKFDVPAMFVAKSPVLSAFSSGRSTCLVFDSGHNTTTATPVNDGYALNKSLIKYDIGGNNLSNELYDIVINQKKIIESIVPHYKFHKIDKLLDINDEDANIAVNNNESQNCYTFETVYLNEEEHKFKSLIDPSYERYCISEIVRDMKENILYLNEENIGGCNIVNYKPCSYELPDGQIVELKEERYLILEKLFNSSFTNNNSNININNSNNNYSVGFNGFHTMINDAINKSDIDIKKELFANIFVTGGNTLFNNFSERLQKQIINTAPPNVKVKMLVHPTPSERKFSAWIGGSILSSLGTFHQMWFSKQEYEEHGSVLIERKCA